MATEKPSLYENFILRGASYKAGMLLLLRYLSEGEWKLGNQFSARLDRLSEQVERLYNVYVDDLKGEKTASFEAANQHFNNSLLKSYTSILDFYTTLDEPAQSLLDAERYSVWLKGRRSFKSPVIFSARENNDNLSNLEIVLSEKPLTDKELLFLEYADNDARWFKSLAAWEQNFIVEHQKELATCSIPSSLRSVPGLANLSYHECKINNVRVLSYFRHATQLPIDLLQSKNTDDEQFRLTCLNLASQIRLSITEKSDALEFPSELVILSQSILSPGKIATAKAKIMSRASDNDTKIYELKEKAITLFQCALADPEAPIDNLKVKTLFFSQDEQSRPLRYKDFLKKWGLIAQNNKVYYKQYPPTQVTLLSTNNPFNALRHFGAYSFQNQHNEFNITLLLGVVSRYLNPLFLANPKINQQKGGLERGSHVLAYIEQSHQVKKFNYQLNELIEKLSVCEKEGKIPGNKRKSLVTTLERFFNEEIKKILGDNVFQLLQALYTLLSVPQGQGLLGSDKKHRPQLRGFAEIMLVNCLGGVAWVACKSGKDRTGAASVATDAAAIYYQQNEKFPHCQNDHADRGHYLKLLKKLLNLGHQQRIASHNAPGANGLINANWFFPGDINLDIGAAQLETQLARLNKPTNIKTSHERFFNYRLLNDDLQDIKDKVVNLTLGSIVTRGDWVRNWDVYFINGRSVRELRKNKQFESDNDLSEFIESHLLGKVEDPALKKYYRVLALYSFHQGGFPHAFSKVSVDLINQCYHRHNQHAIIGQPDVRVNFSWSEVSQGIQIEEISTYRGRKDLETGAVVPPKKGDYYCRVHSCLLLGLSDVSNQAYQLAVTIQSAYVDCAEALLNPVFFLKKPNVLEAFIQFLWSLLVSIKRYFDSLIKPNVVLDEHWVSRANAEFFGKTRVTRDNEQQEIKADQRDPVSLPRVCSV